MTVYFWFGFFGAWLLVAGPLYQGVLELVEHELDREGFEAAYEGLTRPAAPSSRWWLVPPVMFWQRHRSTKRQRQPAHGLAAVLSRSASGDDGPQARLRLGAAAVVNARSDDRAELELELLTN